MLSSPCFPRPPTQRLTQNTCESKKKRPCTADETTAQDSQSVLAQQYVDSVLLTSSYHFQPSSHPAGLPQSTALFLQSPRTAEEEGKQHISVIQTTRLAAGNSPLAQSHREASPLPSRSSPSLISFSSSSSPKHLPPSTSPKHLSHLASPKHSSVSFSPKPLALCSSSRTLSLCSSPKPSSVSSLKPPSLSSLPKAPTLLASQKSSHKSKSLMPSSKHTQLVDGTKSSGMLPDESPLYKNSFKLKQVSYVFVLITFLFLCFLNFTKCKSNQLL